VSSHPPASIPPVLDLFSLTLTPLLLSLRINTPQYPGAGALPSDFNAMLMSGSLPLQNFVLASLESIRFANDPLAPPVSAMDLGYRQSRRFWCVSSRSLAPMSSLPFSPTHSAFSPLLSFLCPYTNSLVCHSARARPCTHLSPAQAATHWRSWSLPLSIVNRTATLRMRSRTTTHRTDPVSRLQRRIPDGVPHQHALHQATHTQTPTTSTSRRRSMPRWRSSPLTSVSSPPIASCAMLLPRSKPRMRATANPRSYQSHVPRLPRHFFVPSAARSVPPSCATSIRAIPTIAAQRTRSDKSPSPYLSPPTLLITHIPIVASPRSAPDFSSMFRPQEVHGDGPHGSYYAVPLFFYTV
jgi:hypothetical protein